MAGIRSRLPIALCILALIAGLLPSMGSADSVVWGKIDPALRALMTEQPQGTWGIIVEAATPSARSANAHSNAERAGKAAERLVAHRAKAKTRLSIIGATSGSADYAAIAALSRDPFVAYIDYDAPMRRLDLAPSSNVYEEVVRATEVWDLGYTGKGVGVAVLDSGVHNSSDLSLPASRIAVHVDFVGDGSTTLDPGGHGTHVAGIIAGNGFSAPQNMVGAYKGVAPGAQIIDVRVIGARGATNVSNVVAGIQWTVQNRTTYNIRVMNLSLGATVPPGYSYRTDPLVAALDVAWLSGITVVVAAGNSGSNQGSIETPGTSPMLITVGAIDDAGTTSTKDDSVPAWSSRGPTPDGLSKPDLVAPGRRIISLFAPGSYLSTTLPDRVTPTAAGTYFRLSGTSMAAPVVAGVAALLLEKNGALKPDQIKDIVTRTSRPVAGYKANVAGAGAVDAYAAIRSGPTDRTNRNKRPADAFARAILPLLKGQPLAFRDSSYAGRNWAGITWDNITWDGITWDNLLWDGIFWDGITWDGIMWDGITWDATWSSVNQDGVEGLSNEFD